MSCIALTSELIVIWVLQQSRSARPKQCSIVLLQLASHCVTHRRAHHTCSVDDCQLYVGDVDRGYLMQQVELDWSAPLPK